MIPSRSVWSIVMGDDSPFYETIRYPGGEYQVRIKPDWCGENPCAVRIVARKLDTDWVIKLALLKSAVDALEPGRVDLVIPYLPYARADRRFVPGDCFGLQVLGGLIEAMGFSSVYTLDAHSAEAARQISGLSDVSALGLISRSIERFSTRFGLKDVVVLFPDEGAARRYVLPESIGNNRSQVNIHVEYCCKVRDAATGKLLSFDVPKLDVEHAIIVDDLCDGGGTFLGIADKLPGRKLGLYVTHGIFSQGFDALHQRFDIIYTTDSFRDVSHLEASVFDSVGATVAGAERWPWKTA